MAIKESVVSARVERRLKDESEAIFRTMGLSTPEAIRMFLTQVTLTRELPFAARPDSISNPENHSDLLLPNEKRNAVIQSFYDD